MMPTSITECPGYESLVDDLVHLLQLPSASARPSGILLTGCAGVGKTRLVQCVTDQLLLKNRTNNNNHNRWSIHRVSAHHLVLQASWATEGLPDDPSQGWTDLCARERGPLWESRWTGPVSVLWLG